MRYDHFHAVVKYENGEHEEIEGGLTNSFHDKMDAFREQFRSAPDQDHKDLIYKEQWNYLTSMVGNWLEEPDKKFELVSFRMAG